MIKFIDTAAQNKIVKDISNVFGEHSLMSDIEKIIDSGEYVMGKYLKAFEEEFAEYIGVKYAVGVNSGTDALKIALCACSVGEGDVLTVSHTFPATIMAIMDINACPVFVDINDNGIININSLKKEIEKCGDAIIPVHFMGHPCDMDRICSIANKYDIIVIEDACQAVGATYKGKKVGSLGDVGCFSFFPTKNLSCCGDGGMITTNDKDIYNNCLLLRDFGRESRDEFIIGGYNSRLDEIQAAILLHKLPYLDHWIEKRNEAADYYIKNIDFLECVKPIEYSISAWHLFVVKVPNNKVFVEKMREKGVDCRIHYSTPCHKQPFIPLSVPYLPNTEEFCKQILSLPISESITRRTQDIVIEKLKECYNETS